MQDRFVGAITDRSLLDIVPYEVPGVSFERALGLAMDVDRPVV
jgi:hypothetical protein